MTGNGQFSMAKIKYSDTREFLWKITLLHGQLCPKPYGFLVKFSWNFGSTWHFGSGWWPLHFWKSWILSKLQLFQSFPTEVAQNDSKWPISPNSQLFQSFPTEVAQNDFEQPILPDSQPLQSFPTEVAHNDLEWPISPNSTSNLFPPTWQLFQSFPTEVAQWLRMAHSQWLRSRPISPNSQLFQSFPTKVARMTLNGQLFQSFPTDLFPHNFPLFSQVAQNDSEVAANFTRFTTSPIFFYWSGSEWPILPNLQLFQSFSTKMAQIMRQCTRPPPSWNGIVEIQISVGTWSSTWMMIFTSWQSRLFVMEIVTLKLNLTNYTYLYTLDHNFVTIHSIWKKWRCKCAQHQGTSFSFFWFIKNIIASH